VRAGGSRARGRRSGRLGGVCTWGRKGMDGLLALGIAVGLYLAYVIRYPERF